MAGTQLKKEDKQVQAKTGEQLAGDTVKDILYGVSVLVRAGSQREDRLVLRALRQASSIRGRLTGPVLDTAIARVYASVSPAPSSSGAAASNGGGNTTATAAKASIREQVERQREARARIGKWIPAGLMMEGPVPDLSLYENDGAKESDGADDGKMDVDTAAADTSTGKGDKDEKKTKKGEQSGEDAKEKKDDGDAKQPKLPAVVTPSELDATFEIEAYLHYLALLLLIDRHETEAAVDCAEALVAFTVKNQRHTMDALGAKAWFYLARAIELRGDQLDSLRARLLAAYRSSCLRRDEIGQAMHLNLLVRGYLASNLFDQADRLIAKCEFPKEASPNQLARHLHYLGWIRAVQLDYTEAHNSLSLALRKAPQGTACGFRLITTKLAVVVQLLMGEIPERTIFSHPQLAEGLVPYFELTKAVRDGNLGEYRDVLEARKAVFTEDRTLSLISRLRASVIKTGLRRVNVAYSAITLNEVTAKLNIEEVSDAENIVAKAIRDDVIEATIDHDAGCVRSKEITDVYTGTDPQAAFNSRIEYALNLRNEATCAMRYPDDKKKETPEEEEERRRRLAEEQEDIQAVLAEEEDDEDY